MQNKAIKVKSKDNRRYLDDIYIKNGEIEKTMMCIYPMQSFNTANEELKSQ